jgi:regulator of replication initiation timing
MKMKNHKSKATWKRKKKHLRYSKFHAKCFICNIWFSEPRKEGEGKLFTLSPKQMQTTTIIGLEVCLKK